MVTPDELIERTLSPNGQALFRERLVRKHVGKHQKVIDKGDCVSGAYFVLDGGAQGFHAGAERTRGNPILHQAGGNLCVGPERPV